ncbi:MAG: hypothetical protein AAF791_05395 [Bacteroidota bacterium]
MFPALRPVLNKGGAGKYISREESVERLQPVIASQLELLRAYDHVGKRIADANATQYFDEVILPRLRTELNKLYETVFSLGGSAPTGAAMDWTASDLDGDDVALLKALQVRDRDFGRQLAEEMDAVHHQERTRAILGHNAEMADVRLGALRKLLATLGR